MNKSYFIFIVIVIAVLCGGVITAGGRVGAYIDISSFLVIILITAALLASTFRLKEMGSFFAGAFRGRPADIQTIKKGICFFTAMQRYLVISAVVGTMIGIIAILTTLAEPAAIGRGLAIALLTIFYAVIFILAVALPFRVSLERRLAETNPSS